MSVLAVLSKHLYYIQPLYRLLLTQVLITAPLLWWTVLCWCLGKIWLPLCYVLHVLADLANGRSPGTQPRTVLVTGGGPGCLALVRAVRRSGMRVVVVEVDDKSTTRLSNAVSADYTVSPPEMSPQNYVRRLVEIAAYENVKHFIPGSSKARVVYDALAKPQLERIGCRCFVPTVEAIQMLQDPTTLEEMAREAGLSTTPLHPVTHPFHVQKLYDRGVVGQGKPRHIMTSVESGRHGRPDELELPETAEQFLETARKKDISAKHPWVVRRRMGGERLVASAVVRDDRVLMLDVTTRTRGHVEFITCSCLRHYIQVLIKNLPLSEPLTGNFVFYFVHARLEGKFYPRSCDVIAGLPLQDELTAVSHMTYLHRRHRSGEKKNGFTMPNGITRSATNPDAFLHAQKNKLDVINTSSSAANLEQQKNVLCTSSSFTEKLNVKPVNTEGEFTTSTPNQTLIEPTLPLPVPPKMHTTNLDITCHCMNNKSRSVVYWMPREVGRFLAHPSFEAFADFIRLFWIGQEVYCDMSDPWPVVWFYLVQNPIQMFRRAIKQQDMKELDISHSEFHIYW